MNFVFFSIFLLTLLSLGSTARQVYGIVSVQLLFTAMVAGLCCGPWQSTVLSLVEPLGAGPMGDVGFPITRSLGGGFTDFFMFIPTWGNDPI